jgi:8-oxo-dGTP pyrophosphatase MutT (NUDIX family)
MHLVAYFPVVDDGHILLVDHRNAQLWLPPGGHVEPNEHPLPTVRREAQEELPIAAEFLAVRPIMIPISETVGLTAGHMDVSLWYALRGNRAVEIDHDKHEFLGVKWLAFSELPLERTDPHMSRFAQKIRSIADEFGPDESN